MLFRASSMPFTKVIVCNKLVTLNRTTKE